MQYFKKLAVWATNCLERFAKNLKNFYSLKLAKFLIYLNLKTISENFIPKVVQIKEDFYFQLQRQENYPLNPY